MSASTSKLMKWGLGLPIVSTGVMYLLHELYFKGGVCKSTARLDNKVAIITGDSVGLHS